MAEGLDRASSWDSGELLLHRGTLVPRSLLSPTVKYSRHECLYGASCPLPGSVLREERTASPLIVTRTLQANLLFQSPSQMREQRLLAPSPSAPRLGGPFLPFLALVFHPRQLLAESPLSSKCT